MIFYISHRNKLAQIRQDAGLTQAQLAKALGVAQSTINSWELGQRTPRAKSAQKISEYFNLPLEEIFSPYEEEVKKEQIITSVPYNSNLDNYKNLQKIIHENNFTEDELKDLGDYASYLVSKRNRNRLAHGLDIFDDNNK